MDLVALTVHHTAASANRPAMSVLPFVQPIGKALQVCDDRVGVIAMRITGATKQIKPRAVKKLV